MIVKITGCIPDGYAIEPVTEDEVLICDMSYLCGFHSYEDALKFCQESFYEVQER